MNKVEKTLVNRWYNTIEIDSEAFLDFAEHIDINSMRKVGGVREVLFENGNTYSVDRVMRETDGDKEKAIIDMLEECGVEFEEKNSFIETGACGTYYDWGVKK